MRLGHSLKNTFVPTLIVGSQQTTGRRVNGHSVQWQGPVPLFKLGQRGNDTHVNTLSVAAGSAHSMALVLSFRKTKFLMKEDNTTKVDSDDEEEGNKNSTTYESQRSCDKCGQYHTSNHKVPYSTREKMTRDSNTDQGWTFDECSKSDYRIQVVAWGRNDGRLGLGDQVDSYAAAPTCISHRSFECRKFRSLENNIKAEIVSIACGTWHSACADSEGHLYMFGSNASGRCGVGNDLHNVSTLRSELEGEVFFFLLLSLSLSLSLSPFFLLLDRDKQKLDTQAQLT